MMRRPRAGCRLLVMLASWAVVWQLGGLDAVAQQLNCRNVILVSIDCLNQRQLSAGIDSGGTPALGRLQKDAVSFTRAYAHAPWTTPSHMCMLTGLYPSEHGRDVPYGLMIKWNAFYPRVPTFQTIGDILAGAGFDTAAFVGKGSISGVYGISQGFREFKEFAKNRNSSDLQESFDKIVAWLGRPHSTPFFLFIHTYDLHRPLPVGTANAKEALEVIDGYVGRLVERLKMLGLYDSTTIFLTGDHGSEMVHTRGKCCVHGAGHYEENLHVPLLMKLPRGAGSGRVTSIVGHVDLLPTVLELVGIDAADYDGPGRSLLQAVAGGGGDKLSFSEADGRCATRKALVTEHYKYIYTPQGPEQALLQEDRLFFDAACTERCRELPIEELYDLDKDPFEEHNLLAAGLTVRDRAALERLRVEMAAHLNLPRHYRVSVVTDRKNLIGRDQLEDLKDSLRALGYIE